MPIAGYRAPISDTGHILIMDMDLLAQSENQN